MGNTQHTGEDTLSASIKAVKTSGFIIVLLFIGLFGFWSTNVPLPQAILANGFIRSAIPNIEVRHNAASVIDEVAVSEGSRVKRGDVLMRMDVAEHRMRHDRSRRLLTALQLERGRITADLDGRSTVEIPDTLRREIAELEMTHALEHEQQRLALAREEHVRRQRALKARAAGLSKTNDRLLERLGFETEQIARARSVAQSFEALRASGRIKATELERMQRTYLGLQATAAETHADLARTELALTDLKHEMAQLSVQTRITLTSRLSEIERLIVQHELDLEESWRRIQSGHLRSPIDGTVFNLQHSNPGVLVPRFEMLMEIIPDEGGLMVDLNIAPNDGDRMRLGSEAEVGISAYSQEGLPRISATVQSISADTLHSSDGKTGFYRARLSLDPIALQRLEQNAQQNVTLKPGMPVDVQIATGSQTLAAYLTEPLRRTLDRSFRE